VRRTKAGLKRKEKVVGVKVRRQLTVDMFLHEFAGNWQNGDRPVVGCFLTVTPFVQWTD
jgi:hypothetical protein